MVVLVKLRTSGGAEIWGCEGSWAKYHWPFTRNFPNIFQWLENNLYEDEMIHLGEQPRSSTNEGEAGCNMLSKWRQPHSM